MMHTATRRKGIPEEVSTRTQIALFWGIAYMLSNTLLAPVPGGLYFIMAALLELFTIQAMRGLFGNTPLVRDANELNFYGFLLHLIAIPFFLYGAQSDWHNYAIDSMVVFYLARLLYFGERRADGEFTGWAKFGALAWAVYFIERAANTITKKRVVFAVRILLAIATIVPLWVITARTHDETTSRYTIMTTAFILLYGFGKHLITNREGTEQALLNDETMPLLEAYNQRTSDARRVIQRIVVEEFTGPAPVAPANNAPLASADQLSYGLSEAELANGDKNVWLVAALFLVIVTICTTYYQRKTMFEFGYASGYTSGKAGTKPESEPSWDRVLECHSRDPRRGPRPDSCYDKPPKDTDK